MPDAPGKPASAPPTPAKSESANGAGDVGLPKTYSPSATEPVITKKWDASSAFHADPKRVLSGERKPYCILIPPPNVTAPLHLGHALNNTLQDVLIRAHRMMGFETLWMPGTDHAGIATQAVVEKRLRKEGKLTGPLKQSMQREEFVAIVQSFKDEYEATIIQQLKDMGCSCDWLRTRFTMDDQCAAAVREAFFRLFKDGLIYRGKRLVNWDPALQTAVADDECYDEEIDGQFYYLKYPLVRVGGESSKAANQQSSKSDLRPVTWNELSRLGFPGATEHGGEEQAWVTVATTRPETYLGDTAVGVNPHDPRAKSLRGLHVELPLVGRVIPIIEDSYVVMPAALARTEEEKADPKAAFATGFLKVTPAHDQNDYQLGQRHNLPMVNIFAPDATISDKHGWDDVGDAHIFVGLSRVDGRKKVVAEFKSRGLLESTKPYRHSVKHSDRSKAIIEPYLSDQWYVRVTDERMAKAANAVLNTEQQSSKAAKQQIGGAGDETLTFYPSRYAKTYENWHDNIRDWCISRQLWWGHQIPVWKSILSNDAGTAAASLESPELLASVDRYRKLFEALGLQNRVHISAAADEVQSWLDICPRDEAAAAVIDAINVFYRESGPWREEVNRDPRHWLRDLHSIVRNPSDAVIAMLAEIAEGMEQGYRQDPDVLDTWFSSGLWPISTMGWPDPAKYNAGLNKDMLAAYNPSDVLCTAREIITLWVSRMVMFNRYFMGKGNGGGPIPFNDVFIHAMIQDGEGRKMSKTLGNGVDPRDIIASHGTDAMRFTLVHMTTQTQDVRMPVEPDPKSGKNTSTKFDIGRNFCNKLWNAARFAMGSLEKAEKKEREAGSGKPLPLIDRWMLSHLAGSVRAVNSALADYQFSEYASTMYDLLWRDFCDWYLEAIKPTVAADARQQAVLAHTLESIVRLLHPIAPFITEAIWEHLRKIETAPVPGLRLEPSRVGGLLCTAGWPEADASLINPEAEATFEQLRGLITAIREVRSQHNVPPKRRITLHATPQLIQRCAAAPGLVEQLAGLESMLATAPAQGATAVPFRFEGTEYFLTNLADAVDAGAESDRNAKRVADLERDIAALDKRLSNPGYAEKAPAKLVEQSRAELAAKREELAALRAKAGGA